MVDGLWDMANSTDPAVAAVHHIPYPIDHTPVNYPHDNRVNGMNGPLAWGSRWAKAISSAMR